MTDKIDNRQAKFSLVARFAADDSGATAIEYALIAMLLSIAVIGSAFLLGGGVSDMWNYVRDEVVTATTF